MDILIIDTKYKMNELTSVNFMPRIGERVDVFYSPLPTVKDVVHIPSKSTRKSFGYDGYYLDAIIFVS